MKSFQQLSLAGLVFCASLASLPSQIATAATPSDGSVSASVTKPSFSASQTRTVRAVVKSINYETREITLIDDMGETQTLIASDSVRNLKQVSPGDTLFAEHVRTISIEVMAGDGLGPDQAEILAAARADEGEMPSGMAVDSVVIVSVVKAINLEDNTFILEGPDGELQEYVARNPENLRRAEVGDIVALTITESLAVAVEKAK